MATWRKVGTFVVLDYLKGQVAKQGGDVASYFCTPDGRVLHAVAGNVTPAQLLKEARWALGLWRRVRGKDPKQRRALVAEAHRTGPQRLRRQLQLRAAALRLRLLNWSGPTNALRPSKARQAARRALSKSARELARSRTRFTRRPVVVQTWRVNWGGYDPGPVNAMNVRSLIVTRPQLVHAYLAQHPLERLETVFPHVWKAILGQAVSDAPVMVRTVNPLVCHRR